MGLYIEQEIEKSYIENGVIRIFDSTIDVNTLDRVLGLFSYYEKNNYNKIILLIASPGGSKDIAFSIRSKIQDLQKKGIIIETHIVSQAASAATIISSSGSKGFRFIDPSATAMIHSVIVTIAGDIKAADRQIKSALKSQIDVVEHYVKYSGQTIKVIEEAISFDNEMTAEEFVSFGLADEVKVY